MGLFWASKLQTQIEATPHHHALPATTLKIADSCKLLVCFDLCALLKTCFNLHFEMSASWAAQASSMAHRSQCPEHGRTRSVEHQQVIKPPKSEAPRGQLRNLIIGPMIESQCNTASRILLYTAIPGSLHVRGGRMKGKHISPSSLHRW